MTASIRLACCALALWVAPISWSHGSVEGGAALASTCLACHGVNGNSSNAEWPSLAGQNAAYIEHQLHLLHDGRRTGKVGDAGATMMPAMATALTDQNIEDVAAYYSQQTPAGLEADPSYWQAGQRLYRSGDRDPRHSRLFGLSRPVRSRQSGGRLSGAARPTFRVCRQAAQCLQRRRALRQERARRRVMAATMR